MDGSIRRSGPSQREAGRQRIGRAPAHGGQDLGQGEHAGLDELGDREGQGRLEPAHLVVFDPAEEWTVDPAKLASRSRNTPYSGRTVRGKVRHTLLCGEPTVLDGEAQR